MTSLLDVLKETDLRVDFTHSFTGTGTRTALDRASLNGAAPLSLWPGDEHGAQASVPRCPRMRIMSYCTSGVTISTRMPCGMPLHTWPMHFSHPRCTYLGRHDGLCLGREAFWGVGPESVNGMAPPLWGARGDGVLACGETSGLHLFATENRLVVGSRHHARRAPPPWDRDAPGKTMWIVMAKVRSRLPFATSSISSCCPPQRDPSPKLYRPTTGQPEGVSASPSHLDSTDSLGPDPAAL